MGSHTDGQIWVVERAEGGWFACRQAWFNNADVQRQANIGSEWAGRRGTAAGVSPERSSGCARLGLLAWCLCLCLCCGEREAVGTQCESRGNRTWQRRQTAELTPHEPSLQALWENL